MSLLTEISSVNVDITQLMSNDDINQQALVNVVTEKVKFNKKIKEEEISYLTSKLWNFLS